MGICPECEADGQNAQHNRTAGPGLCWKHYKRNYRKTERGKAVTHAANMRYAKSEKGKATKRRLRSRDPSYVSPIEIAMRGNT